MSIENLDPRKLQPPPSVIKDADARAFFDSLTRQNHDLVTELKALEARVTTLESA